MAPVPKASGTQNSGVTAQPAPQVKAPGAGNSDVPMELQGGNLMPGGGPQVGMPGAMPIQPAGLPAGAIPAPGGVMPIPPIANPSPALAHALGDGATPYIPGGVCPRSHSMPYKNAGPGARNRFEIMPDMQNINAIDGLLYTPPGGVATKVLPPAKVNAAAELAGRIHVIELFMASGQIAQLNPQQTQQLQQHLANLRSELNSYIADALTNAGVIPGPGAPIANLPEADELINFLQHVGLSYRQDHLAGLLRQGVALTVEQHNELNLLGEPSVGGNGTLPPGRLQELENDGMPGVLAPITAARAFVALQPQAPVVPPVQQEEKIEEPPPAGPMPGEIPVEKAPEPIEDVQPKKEEKKAEKPPEPQRGFDPEEFNFFRTIDWKKILNLKPPTKKEEPKAAGGGNKPADETKKADANSGAGPQPEVKKNDAKAHAPSGDKGTGSGKIDEQIPKNLTDKDVIKLLHFGGTPIDFKKIPRGVKVEQAAAAPFEPPLDAPNLTPDEYKEVTKQWLAHLRESRKERNDSSTFGSRARRYDLAKLFVSTFKNKGLTPDNTPAGVESARVYLLLQDQSNQLAKKRIDAMKKTEDVLAGRVKWDDKQLEKLMTGFGKQGVGVRLGDLHPGIQEIIEKSPGLDHLVNDEKDSRIPYDAVLMANSEGAKGLSALMISRSSTGIGISPNARYRAELTMLIASIEDAEKKGDSAKAAELTDKLLEHPVVQKGLEKAEKLRTAEINAKLEKGVQINDDDVADSQILSGPRPKVAEKPKNDVQFKKEDYEKHSQDLKVAFEAAKQAGDTRGMAILWNAYISPLSEYPPDGVTPIHLTLDRNDVKLVKELPAPKPAEFKAYKTAVLMRNKLSQQVAQNPSLVKTGSDTPIVPSPDAITRVFNVDAKNLDKDIEALIYEVHAMSPQDRLVYINALATALSPPGNRAPGMTNMEVVWQNLLAVCPDTSFQHLHNTFAKDMKASNADLTTLLRAHTTYGDLAKQEIKVSDGPIDYALYNMIEMLYVRASNGVGTPYLTDAEVRSLQSFWERLGPEGRARYQRQWTEIFSQMGLTNSNMPGRDPGVCDIEVLLTQARFAGRPEQREAFGRSVTLQIALPRAGTDTSAYTGYIAGCNYAVPGFTQMHTVTFSSNRPVSTNTAAVSFAQPVAAATQHVFAPAASHSTPVFVAPDSHVLSLRSGLESLLSATHRSQSNQDAFIDAEVALAETDDLSSASDASDRLLRAYSNLQNASQIRLTAPPLGTRQTLA